MESSSEHPTPPPTPAGPHDGGEAPPTPAGPHDGGEAPPTSAGPHAPGRRSAAQPAGAAPP